MNYLKLIGYGVLIWIVIFLVVSIFVGFNVSSDNIIVKLITEIVIIILALILAKKLNLSSRKELVKYSFVWFLIALILDLIFTTKFSGSIFSEWSALLGYILILLVPLLAVKKS